ncbi:MAG: hypothetical protein WAQ28_08210 [Bacteroidia bacterium]
MNSNHILKLLYLVIISAFIAAGNIFAQGNNFKLDGNNNGSNNSKLGFTNSADLKIITRDSVRQTITQNGDVIIEKTLTVKGGIISDSVVKFSSNVIIDSTLRVRNGLIVGDSSLYFDDNVSGPPVHDRIRSSQGKLSFMQGSNIVSVCGFTGFPPHPVYCTTKVATPNILTGIGTETPKSRLDVFGGAAIGTYAGVNAAPANGLIVSGNVGINTSAPSQKLTIHDGDILMTSPTGGGTPAISLAGDAGIALEGLIMQYSDVTNNITFDQVLNNAAAGMFFRNRTAGTPLNTMSLVNGNVGLNIVNPSSLLHTVASGAKTTSPRTS